MIYLTGLMIHKIRDHDDDDCHHHHHYHHVCLTTGPYSLPIESPESAIYCVLS